MYSPRFKRAYNALIDAFFNGTLAKGNCAVCAVGNIVAACNNISVLVKGDHVSINGEEVFDFPCAWPLSTARRVMYWGDLFCTSSRCQDRYFEYEEEDKDMQFLMEKLYNETGYTPDEMAQIEFAFENNTGIYLHSYLNTNEQLILEDQFNGLMAVMEVLLELEGITEGQALKDKFKEHPKLVLS